MNDGEHGFGGLSDAEEVLEHRLRKPSAPEPHPVDQARLTQTTYKCKMHI